jgi:hypothetical protein
MALRGGARHGRAWHGEAWQGEDTMNLKFDADRLRTEIQFLLVQYPELQDDEDLLLGTLEGSTQLIEFLTAVHRYREDTRALADGSQQRMDELVARKKRLGLRVEFITRLMQSILSAAQIRKIELPEVTLSIRSNPQTLHVDETIDLNELPEDLIRIKREVDRKKIREALLEGRNVPGCVLTDAPPSLSVRVK